MSATAAAVLGAFASGAAAQTDVQTGLERALKIPLEIVWLRGEVRSEAWAGNPRPGVALQDCTTVGGPRQGCGVTWRPPTCLLLGPGSQSDQTCVSLSLRNGSQARFVAGERRAPRSRVYVAPLETQRAEAVRAPSGQILLAAGSAVYLMDVSYPGIGVEVRAPAEQPLLLGDLSATAIGKVFALLLRQPEAASASAAVLSENGRVALRSSPETQLAAV